MDILYAIYCGIIFPTIILITTAPGLTATPKAHITALARGLKEPSKVVAPIKPLSHEPTKPPTEPTREALKVAVQKETYEKKLYLFDILFYG